MPRLLRLSKRVGVLAIVAMLFITGCFVTMQKLSLNERKSEITLESALNVKEDKEAIGLPDTILKSRIAFKTANVLRTTDHSKEILKTEKVLSDVNQVPDVNTVGTVTGLATVEVPPRPNYNVHIFYYAWYGNPEVDGNYMHWDHKYLSHWIPEIDQRYRHGKHNPPDDIGSNFYPALGPYSSRDPKVIHDHMRQMCAAGVGVMALSWYPPGKADDQGFYSDKVVQLLLDIAHLYDMKVTLHIEPYNGRNDETLHRDVKYIIDKYSTHNAFYKYKHKDGRILPFLYVYDSYRTSASDWARLLKPEGSHSVRNTKYDCIFISLMVESTHRDAITIGGFDGFYTYFATDGFTYGSAWRRWGQLASFARQTNTLFIPSVGPGYIDTSVRPWNSKNTRPRLNGEYYKKSWTAALSVHPEIVSITSFNEWHEGTQIEKAIPKSVLGQVYNNYSPNEPDFYIKLTREFVTKLAHK